MGFLRVPTAPNHQRLPTTFLSVKYTMSIINELEQLLDNLSVTSKSRPILRPEQIAETISKFPRFPFDDRKSNNTDLGCSV
ncbi:hypothetical protein BDW42DRAFT_99995 [Aspergillus taichungensis]|uniref:Uncharacterized protein n=1 Tax=Aspergillus taichungensis TaxID=482145 RepID=A0A2J5HV19_9EURO|nr:hypothetical protein BDW42DRAFT_99995 [Aspergillus taichungensis]